MMYYIFQLMFGVFLGFLFKNVNLFFLFNKQEFFNVVSGVKLFNSGKLVKNNSFFYIFDEFGNFIVVFQGVFGYVCIVNVILIGK